MRKILLLAFVMFFWVKIAQAQETTAWQAFAISKADAQTLENLLDNDGTFLPGQKSDVASLLQEQFFALAITIIPPVQTYFYSHDTTYGLPTALHGQVTWALPDGSTGQQVPGVFGPAPVEKARSVFASTKLAGVDDAKALIYPDSTTFVLLIPKADYGVSISLNLQALFCSAKSCQPFFENIDLSFSQEDISGLSTLSDKAYVRDLSLVMATPALEQSSERAVAGQRGELANELAQQANLEVYKDFKPRFANPYLEVDGLWKALVFGLLAGLILNLMPCVLPVISLKFSALLMVSGYASQIEKEKAFRHHCLFFSAGVLTWFMVLAILLGLAGFAWGGLFQNPYVIASLGMLLFLLGLSLFDVFVLPVFDLRVSAEGHPHWQAYASGVLATLLATPCSGPLLGGVLGWAVNQPLYFLVLTISSVGVGMALPYLLMAVFPGLVRFLPKPGAWTLRLEQILGFFLMATVAYMTTLLPDEWLRAYIFILVSASFAAWLWGQIGNLSASRLKRLVSRICAVALVFGSVWLGYSSLQEDTIWEPFDEATFNAALGQEHILLEFTADWCPSCKAMEYTTLNKKRMRLLQSRYKMRTIKVDLTRRNLAGEALLASLDSTSIPVIALFPAGELAKEPLVLRDIVTPEQLDAALHKVFAQ